MLHHHYVDRMSDDTVSVVVPVRDESIASIDKTLALYREGHWLLPNRIHWRLIIVDDGSRIPFPGATYRHKTPQGYGAALKTGILHAHTEWILTADGDGQHRLRDMERLVEFTKDFPELDMVIGDRRVREQGIRLWGRKGLNWLATLFAGRWINDLNSGMRIFRRRIALGYLPILSDQFSFTTGITLAMIADGYKVDFLPIRVSPRQFGQTKVKLLTHGWQTLKLICWIGLALRTRWLRQWLRPLWAWVRS